jgi:hypothetical protein
MQMIMVIDQATGTPIGVASNEDKAKNGLTDGAYVLIPFNIDIPYPNDYFSAGAPGAITYTPATDGIAAAITALTAEVAALRTEAQQAIVEDRARLTDIEAALVTINGRLDALEVT